MDLHTETTPFLQNSTPIYTKKTELLSKTVVDYMSFLHDISVNKISNEKLEEFWAKVKTLGQNTKFNESVNPLLNAYPLEGLRIELAVPAEYRVAALHYMIQKLLPQYQIPHSLIFTSYDMISSIQSVSGDFYNLGQISDLPTKYICM